MVALRGSHPGARWRWPTAIRRTRRGSTHLFTGDSLFPGGVGNTQENPGQSFDSLYCDVPTPSGCRTSNDDDTWVYPGHGKDTTLGVERPHLDEWRDRGW